MAQIDKALRKEMVDKLVRNMYRSRKAELESIEFKSPIQGWQDKVSYQKYGLGISFQPGQLIPNSLLFKREPWFNDIKPIVFPNVDEKDYEEQFRNPKIEEA